MNTNEKLFLTVLKASTNYYSLLLSNVAWCTVTNYSLQRGRVTRRKSVIGWVIDWSNGGYTENLTKLIRVNWALILWSVGAIWPYTLYLTDKEAQKIASFFTACKLPQYTRVQIQIQVCTIPLGKLLISITTD